MNVLILGSGGREHAFAWKIAQSKKLSKLYIAPGNAGTAMHGENIPVSTTDFSAIKKLVLDKGVNLVIVGPEDPLVKGIRDFFLTDSSLINIPVIGPDKAGAMLEGSKNFSKQFMIKYDIPTAKYKSITKENLEEGYIFLTQLKPPYVLKADGLAAGKGVLIIEDIQEARKELASMILDAKFGSAGNTVVIEEFLKGIELSAFVLSDGKGYKILPSAKDYKRIGDDDTGLNTGGMGAISPVPFADASFLKKVEERIIIPTVNGLKNEGIDYRGFIFIGLMNCNGDPYVIEYNCRMGDPETEVILPRIKSDLLDLLEGVASQTLSEKKIETDERTAVTVVLVAGGYPEDYEKGKIITGLELVNASIVFHAGTKDDSGNIKTNGGRVIAVTSYGNNLKEALNISYSSIGKIKYEGMYYRKDIGKDLLLLINKQQQIEN